MNQSRIRAMERLRAERDKLHEPAAPTRAKQHIYTIGDRIRFGKKHLQETIAQVMDDDPEWLRWAVINDLVELTPFLEAELEKALRERGRR